MISPSNILPIVLKPERFLQNCQAGFGRCELRGQSVERQNAFIGTSQEIICFTLPQEPHLELGPNVERHLPPAR